MTRRRVRAWMHGGLATAAAAVTLAAMAAPASAFTPCPDDVTAPTAAFSVSPGTPVAGSAATFDAGASQDGYRTSYAYDSTDDMCHVISSGSVAITSYTWSFGDGSAPVSGASATASHTFASPGTYTVQLTVSAPGAGTDTAEHSISTAWTVTLTQPAQTSFWKEDHKRQTIALAATAAGPTSIQRMEFWVRGVKVAEDTAAPYSASLDTATLADGDAGVYARVVGTDSTAGSSATRNIVIDNTPPAFTMLQQPGVVQPGHDTFTVRFTDEQWLYGNANCWADSVTPVNTSYCVGAGVAKTFEAPYTFNLPEGPHTVYFAASDAAGNTTVGTGTVVVDGTPPETSITSGPADGSSSTDASPSFALAASEPGSTFTCRLYRDGSAAPELGPCSAAAGHSASGLAPGTYRFEAVSRDVAGNEDPTPASRTFTVASASSSSAGSGGTAPQQVGTDTTTTSPAQGGNAAGTPNRTAGKCAKLKGKKRARCVRRSCAKAKKKGRKRYRACVNAVTRKR